MKALIMCVLIFFVSLLHRQALTADCEFQFLPNKTKVSWTAFKTTKKVAVNGTFQKFQVAGHTKGKDPISIFEGLTFAVDTQSVDTKNPARDQTLLKHFFSWLSGGYVVRGLAHSFDTEKNQFQLLLSLNGTTLDIPMTYEKEEQSFFAKGIIDILDFNANIAFNKLHEACNELHKGDDGRSKTWSEVQIKMETEMRKTCTGKKSS